MAYSEGGVSILAKSASRKFGFLWISNYLCNKENFRIVKIRWSLKAESVCPNMVDDKNVNEPSVVNQVSVAVVKIYEQTFVKTKPKVMDL